MHNTRFLMRWFRLERLNFDGEAARPPTTWRFALIGLSSGSVLSCTGDFQISSLAAGGCSRVINPRRASNTPPCSRGGEIQHMLLSSETRMLIVRGQQGWRTNWQRDFRSMTSEVQKTRCKVRLEIRLQQPTYI